MNAKIAVLALATVVSTTASAQSKPTFVPYGIADVSVGTQNTGFGYRPSVNSGGFYASRFGFKGEAPLADAVAAVYVAEGGLHFDLGDMGNSTPAGGINNSAASSGGGNGTGPQLFARQMFAGIRTPAGSLLVGRQYAGSYLVAAGPATPWPGMYGSSATILALNGMPTRVNNAAVYVSPTLAGLRAYLLAGTGSENNVDGTVASGTAFTNARAGRIGEATLFYSLGSLNLGASAWYVYNNTWVTGETGLAIKKGWQAAANYDFFGHFTVYGTVTQGQITGGNYENVTKTLSKSVGWSGALMIPYGNSRLAFNYTNLNDKSKLNKDGDLLGVMYWYKLKPQTTVYTSAGWQKNHGTATYSLTDAGSLVGTPAKLGSDARGFQVGFAQEF
jgi:predicted porin